MPILHREHFRPRLNIFLARQAVANPAHRNRIEFFVTRQDLMDKLQDKIKELAEKDGGNHAWMEQLRVSDDPKPGVLSRIFEFLSAHWTEILAMILSFFANKNDGTSLDLADEMGEAEMADHAIRNQENQEAPSRGKPQFARQPSKANPPPDEAKS